MPKPETSDTASLQAMDPVEKTGRYRPGSRDGVGGVKSTYSEAVGLEICARMADGENLTAICRDQALPARSTVTRWLLAFPEFAALYAVAREALLDSYADDIMNISDDGTTDMVMKTGRNGHEYEAVDQEHIQRSRLRVDSRKWLLSKLRPEKYGDRITADVTGSIDHKHDITGLSEREKMRRFALFMVEDQALPAIEGELAKGTKSLVADETMAKVSQSASTEPDDAA